MDELSIKNYKKLIEWEWLDYWQLAVKKYRVSKKIRQLIKRNGKFDFNGLAQKLDVDRHYIYQVMVMNVKPSDDFINKLDRLRHEKI